MKPKLFHSRATVSDTPAYFNSYDVNVKMSDSDGKVINYCRVFFNS